MTMQTLLTRTHFEAALTPPVLRGMAIVQAALLAGPLIYVVPMLIVLQNMGSSTPIESEYFVLNMLSMMNAIFLFAAFSIGTFLFYRIFSAARLPVDRGYPPEKLALIAVANLRTALILRIALLEGAALLGISVCVIGLTRGIMDAEPMYYLNLGSLFVMVVYGLWTFPTKERVLSWFEDSFRVGT